MKTKLILIISIFSILFFSSCKKENTTQFNYPIADLYGTWNGTSMYLSESSEWIDITKYPYTQFAVSATFKPDGTYYGRGYFGNGSGTYIAAGNSVTTFVDGQEFARYVIMWLSETNAEVSMSMGDTQDYIRMRLKKE